MNKEINKIIANLEGCVGMFDYMLTPTESNLLVSYLKELQKENKQLKDNWNIIKQEMLKIRQSTFSKYNSNEWDNCLSFNGDIKPILDKMQELEGSDNQ